MTVKKEVDDAHVSTTTDNDRKGEDVKPSDAKIEKEEKQNAAENEGKRASGKLNAGKIEVVSRDEGEQDSDGFVEEEGDESDEEEEEEEEATGQEGSPWVAALTTGDYDCLGMQVSSEQTRQPQCHSRKLVMGKKLIEEPHLVAEI